MARNDLKTRATKQSVTKFIAAIEDDQKRKDTKKIVAMMKTVTGERPKMWGESIIGFGSYHYQNASGREGDWPLTGMSPRKTSLTVYIMPGFTRYTALMKKLGKHKTGKSCLYIKKLEDVDPEVLETLITPLGRGNAPDVPGSLSKFRNLRTIKNN